MTLLSIVFRSVLENYLESREQKETGLSSGNNVTSHTGNPWSKDDVRKASVAGASVDRFMAAGDLLRAAGAQGGGARSGGGQILLLLLRLRQCCSHPCLMKDVSH